MPSFEATKNSEDSESELYIYILINNKTKNKQLPISNCLHSISRDHRKFCVKAE